MSSFKDKVIAITGGASGIGLATAHLLASRGASVSIADVAQEPLEAAITSIKESSPEARIYHKAVDVTKSPEVDTWLDETVKELGGLHGAANLAGVTGISGTKDIRDLTDDDWDFIMDVNLKGAFHCLRAELHRMGEGASIVNASSVAGLKGYQKGGAYSVSKHGIVGMTKTAAQEEGERGIRLNCIAPGPIDTPMIQSLIKATQGDTSIFAANLCIKRQGTADEVAKLIAFLLSDESTYVTGSCYSIDGGYMA